METEKIKNKEVQKKYENEDVGLIMVSLLEEIRDLLKPKI